MKELLDLDTLSKILSDKGYNGYFTTQAAYPGKIRESILEYLQSCTVGLDKLKPEFMLRGYLEWLGDDKPSVECHIWIKHEKGTFNLQKMEITRKDQFGQPLAHLELTDLSASTVPKKNEAIAMISESITQESAAVKKHFRL
jgi:hypothetical protein